MSVPAQPLVLRLEGPAPERDIARDIVKKAALVGPVLVVLATLVWGWRGGASAGYAVALVSLNFLLSAALITWTARISVGLMMGTVLFGYLIRLALVFVAIWLVKDASWVKLLPLGLTIIVTQLGLLMWELRYVSASLAFPGLKPAPKPPSAKAPNPPTAKDGR